MAQPLTIDKGKTFFDDEKTDFLEFIAPEVDRFAFLLRKIEKLKLNALVVCVEEGKHIFIFPRGIKLKLSAGDAFPFRGKNPVLLSAHYDRAFGSPGANDNSVSIFLLLQAAVRLSEKEASNWIIVFTDKEELQKGEKITSQGAFALARKLKQLGLSGARIFNFDACGTGDTFIFSSTTNYLLEKNASSYFAIERKIKILQEQILNSTKRLHLSKFFFLPVPFSDDAGFLRAGLPAQTITTLPSNEAFRFAALLRTRPKIVDSLICGALKSKSDSSNIPQTWSIMNSEKDTYDRLTLTTDTYETIIKLAVDLCIN